MCASSSCNCAFSLLNVLIFCWSSRLNSIAPGPAGTKRSVYLLGSGGVAALGSGGTKNTLIATGQRTASYFSTVVDCAMATAEPHKCRNTQESARPRYKQRRWRPICGGPCSAKQSDANASRVSERCNLVQ